MILIRVDDVIVTREEVDLFLLVARRELVGQVLRGYVATVDPVRAAMPSPVFSGLFASVPAPLVNAGIIRRCGRTRTTRPAARGRWVAVWTLASSHKARQWLFDHPDPYALASVIADRNDAMNRLAGQIRESHTPTYPDCTGAYS